MMTLYSNILESISKGKKLLAVLIDPDKMHESHIEAFMKKVNDSIATHIFLGGSILKHGNIEKTAKLLKSYTELPIVLFPGDESQLTDHADGLLFLSLISGRNPDYLIDKHVKAVSQLQSLSLEVIPTGYILIENGIETAVERVSKTKPIARQDLELIVNTAKAGEYLGMKLIYLEAGSGAKHPIDYEIIQKVKSEIQIPLIVGGGIRSKEQLQTAYSAGADLVVIGTAFEQDLSFFNHLKRQTTY
ncbi:geranylgeranylglyceryl/heptaprenylglyceryl phosphate synthase [uncultured Winogradskyella sp.]|uniref:geranylgeranylglyceryl/heptaprenylglyceryl phosphate synthase n=1 Tax=uncultured Winogradskyella sp. TaxID=395353 RepID=UPI00351997B5